MTFWVYLETRSVLAAAIIGGSYMLFVSIFGVFFGSIVDHQKKRVSMLISHAGALAGFCGAGIVYMISPDADLLSVGSISFWSFILLALLGAIAGNIRYIAMSTAVSILVPEDTRDRANGMVGMVTGLGYAITSVFSGLVIGKLGMGWALVIAIGLISAAMVHLLFLRIDEPHPRHGREDEPRRIDLKGTIGAIRQVPGLMALIFFSTFNNFLGGVFMALMDPYGLNLVSVQVWGFIWGGLSFAFIIGGIGVARKGLGPNPLRTLLLINVIMWAATVLFPLRSSIVMLVLGLLVYMALMPAAEASEQTIIQRVVPVERQGRVFGFAQTIETAATPITAFLIGPIAQYGVIPFMDRGGGGASSIGRWFGVGPERGMALIFLVAGVIGLAMSIAAMNSRSYRLLSRHYAETTAPKESEAVSA